MFSLAFFLLFYSAALDLAAEEISPPDIVVNDYVKNLNKAIERSIKLGLRRPVIENDVRHHAFDVNGDNILDWLIYSDGECGSRGCTSEVYIASENNTYCYVGSGDINVFIKRNRIFSELKCGIVPIREIGGAHEPMSWMSNTSPLQN